MSETLRCYRCGRYLGQLDGTYQGTVWCDLCEDELTGGRDE
jgi:hypothetical protein